MRAYGSALARTLWTTSALSTVAFAGSGAAQAEEAALWQPQVRTIIRGDEQGAYSALEGFVPLKQSADSVLFLDLRLNYDFSDGLGTDVGLGLRRVVNPDLILGGYAYFNVEPIDGHRFTGATLGVEAIATKFDAHLNVNLPFGGQSQETSSVTSGLSFVGNELLEQVSVLNVRDYASWGVEGEIGVQAPLELPADHSLRLSVGGYHFADVDDIADSITGAKAGLEYEIGAVSNEDVSITFGGEVRYDNVYETTLTGFARLTIPLGEKAAPRNGEREPVYAVSEGLRKRANDRVRGDIGVRIDTDETSATFSRRAQNLAGQEFGLFFFADGENSLGLGTLGDPTTLDDAVAKAGSGFVVALGGRGNLLTGGVTLRDGQTVIGGGQSVQARLFDGRTGSVSLGGSDGSIQGTNSATPVLDLGNGNTLQGITVTGGGIGILGSDIAGATLTNVTVSGAGGDGASFTGTSTGINASNFTSTGNAGSGLSIAGDGTYNFTGTTLLSANAVDGLSITGNGTYNFQTIDALSNADDGIDVTSTSGSFATTGGTIAANGDIGVKVDPINANVVLTSITHSGGTSGVLLDDVAGSFTVTGTTAISNTTGAAIAISNSPASIRFGDVAITNPGGDGMTFAGTNGPVVVGGIVIAGIGAGNAGLDFSGGNTTFTAQSVTITGTDAAGSIGIDLAATLGAAAITITNGGTIANVDTGVRLGIAGSPASTANANFTFGGGTIGGQTASLDGRGLNPVSGSYAFGSTVFNGPQLFSAANLIFVGSAATGSGDGSSVNDLATIATADANAAADAVFVLVNDGAVIVDADGFTLASGQTLASFGNGAQIALGGLPLNVTGINIQNGAVQSDPTGNGAAILTSGAAAGTVTLGPGTFLANIDLVGTGAGNVVNLGNGSSLDGVGISGGGIGIFGSNVAGATLTNVAVSGAGSHGASFAGTSTNINATNFIASGIGGSGLSIASDGLFNFAGSTLLSGNGLDGLTIAGAGTYDFQTLNIANPGGDGISYSGTGGTITAGVVTINGLGAGDTGLDFSGSGVNFSATSVGITGTNGAGSTGIDLSGTQSGSVSVGSGSSIVDVATGVQLGTNGAAATTANTTFSFGGGTIEGTTASLDMRGLLAGSGTYTFDATTLVGPQLFDATNIVFVGAANTGSGSGTTVNDLINAAAADQLTTDPNTIFALVGTAPGQIIDTDADGFTLAPGQSLVSFANGATVTLNGPPANVIGTNGTNLVTGGPQPDPFGAGAPTLNNAAGSAISLSDGNVVSNLIATASTGAINGSGINGFTSQGVEIRGATMGLQLDGALGTITVGNLKIAGPVQTGILLANTAATMNFTGTTTIAGGANAGLLADNFDGTANFADLDITFGNIGIAVLNGSGGSLSFGAPSSIAGTSGVAFSIQGSAPTVTYDGTITQTSAASAVDIDGMTGGTVTFGGLITASTGAANAIDLTNNAGGSIDFVGGLDLETDGGFAFRAVNGGTLTVVGSSNTVTTGLGLSENGILIGGTGMTIGAAGVNFSNVTVDGSGGTVGTGIVVENTSGGNVAFGNVAISRVNGDAVRLTNVSGTYTFSGTTTIDTVVAGGSGFSVANSSATVSVANLVTTNVSGADVNLAGNTGAITIGGAITNTVGDGVAVSGGSAVIDIDANISSAAGAGGAAVRVDGISGGSIDFDGNIASTGAGNLFAIGTTTAPAAGTINFSGTGVTASGGGSVVIAGLSATATMNVSAPLSVTGAAVDGISVTNSAGALTFGGQTTITNPGLVGVDIEGTNGTISFADLDIALQTANTTGIDLSNAIVNGNIAATDFDLTSTTATGTVGVNLAGATRTASQSVRLGDTVINGESATIAGVATGVLLSSTTSIDFTFGDGEASDVLSSISAGTPIALTDTFPAGGGYNFLDVNLTGDTSNLETGLTFYYVDSFDDGLNNGTRSNPGTIAGAMASGADAIILVDTTGADTIDVASAFQGSGTTLTLAANQRLYSFNAGDTISIGGGAPANFLLTGIEAGAVTNPFAGTGAPVLTTMAGGANTVSLAGSNLLQGVVISSGPGGFAAAGTSLTGLTISDSVLGGLLLANTTGTATVTNTTLTHLAISGGSINFTGTNADITTTANVASVSASGGHSGTLGFDALSSISVTAGTGLHFDNADGMYAFNGITTLNGGDAGIDILNGSGGSFIFGTGTSVNNPSGTAFAISDSTAAVAYNGTITQNSAASAVVATNNTGGSMTFGRLVVANTGTANAISLTGNTGATISFNGGLDIDTTSGAGFVATAGGTVNVAGAGNSIVTASGTALNLAGMTVGAGGLNFANVSANGATTGIALADIALSGGGSINLGTVSLQNVTSRGVDISGISAAAISFADLDISLNNTSAVAFDLNAATINASVIANDFDVTNNAAAGTTIGVDLRDATGGSVVRLGDTLIGGASSSIAGVDTGVFLNSATDLAFVYGDGESTTDKLSSIAANVGIDASSAPATGSYNFLDVDFLNSPGLGFGVGKIYFVGASATGDGSGRDQSNLATLAATEAASGADDVLVLVNDGGPITAAGSNADNTLVLSDGEQVRGFGNGNINLALTPPSTIQLANTSISIVDATPNGAATLTSAAGAEIIMLGSQDNIIDGFILDGAPAGAARGIIDNGAGASDTVVSNMTIRNFGAVGVDITPSSGTTIDNVVFSGNASDVLLNAANTTITNVTSTGATGTAFQILNATGTTTLTNVSISGAGAGGILFGNAAGTVNATNVDISGAAPLAITGGTAAFSFDASSSITTSSGVAVSVSGGHSTGTFSFAGSVLATGGSGIAFDNADGTYNFTGDVDLSNTITNGIAVLNGSAGTFSFSNAGSTITDPTGIALLIDGGAGGFSYAGTVSKTTDGQAVSIANKTGGTVNLGGAISSTGQSDGIALSNNTGATINLAGLLTLNTSASNTTAFSVTGGTVTATGSGNTINSGTAVALNMGGVTVGASGVAFASTNKAAGGTSAVILSNVTGTGAINLGSGALGGGSDSTIRIGDGAGGANTGGTAGLTYSGSIASSTAGRTIDIQDRAAGAQNITLSGNITHNVAGQTGIFLDDNAAGTITFSGTSKSITSGTAAGINATDNTGATINFTGGGLVVNSTSGIGFNATGGGTITVQGTTNSIASVSAAALNVQNTFIGASGLTFQRIDAGNNTAAADPANGIVLNNTGTTAGVHGGLTVTGDGGTTNNGSGGTIQNTSGAGISLTATRDVSLDQMNIQNTGGSGINGTTVTSFTFTNGTINNSGNALLESNIAFNTGGGVNTHNIAGTFTVTGSTLTNAFDSGIDIQSGIGTVSVATISNNTISSTTDVATSKGDGIKIVGIGSATNTFNLTRATLSGNQITNFPSGGGIQVNMGNSNAAGPGAIAGVFNSGTDTISITGNTIRGESATNRMNTHAIIVVSSGGNPGSRSQANFVVTGNDLRHTSGITLGIGNNGYSDMSVVASNNTIVANNAFASGGISGGNGVVLGGGTETPLLHATVENNNISQTDGNGILLVGRGTSGQAFFKINNNTVAAPLTGVRPGIRVDAGNASSGNDQVFLEITGNTTGGSGGSAGIGVRKQGTNAAINVFGIEGLAPSPADETQTQNYISSLNPNSAIGTGFDGSPSRTIVISGSNFVSAVVPLMAAPGGVEAAGVDLWGDVLTGETLDSLIAAAIDRWSALGITDEQLAALNATTFDIADLGGNYLGLADGNHVLLDGNGAGYGWYVDATPLDDAEFANRTGDAQLMAEGTQAPAGQYDLLTTIMHEFGHVLGFGDTYAVDQSATLMYGWLQTGERRLPQTVYAPVDGYYSLVRAK